MTTILDVGKDERVIKHGRGSYTFGGRVSTVAIDPALGKAIERLVAERDAAVKRVTELETAARV
jgi:hypothetical protein